MQPIGRPAARVKTEKIGTDINNSVTIHRFQDDEDGSEEDVVAVITNNDRTVKIWSLTHDVEVAVLELPFPMNHATISPDGQLLVAVGDFHQAYFYERVKSPPVTSKLSTSRGPVAQKWEILSIVPLHCPTATMASPYFSSAWSPSSSLCAVGSESGFITIFDADMLRFSDDDNDDESPVVRVIAGTRPDVVYGPGGIRAMCFSPQPWDLLIWAEDHGNLCIADVRTGLVQRQAIELEPSGPNVTKRELVDTASESDELRELNHEVDFIRRYRRAFDPEGNTSAINITTDYLEASLERRRLQRVAGVTTSDEDPHGLTAQERQILEALRTTRQRQEAQERTSAPRSIQYSPTVFNGNEPRRSVPPPSSDFPALRSERSSQTTILPPLGSLRDFLRERNLDPDRPPFHPRRQASVVLPNDASGDSSTHGLSTSTLSLPLTTDPWRTIEAAMAHSPIPDSSLRVRPPVEAMPDPSAEFRRHRQALRMRDRQRNLREMQLLGNYETHLLRRSTRTNGDPAWGLRTAGLAMSQDGRRLFVGCEQGIFEFAINVQARKAFPAVQTR